MKERVEQGGIFRIEDIQADQLSKRLETLLQDQPNADELLLDAALLVEDLKTGKDPDFDWVPDHLLAPVKSAWTETHDRLVQFKEHQAEAQQAMAAEHKEERLSAELQERAERSAKLSELEEKFGEIPEEGTPIPQRQIATQIVRKPQKSGFRKFMDRLAGNP